METRLTDYEIAEMNLRITLRLAEKLADGASPEKKAEIFDKLVIPALLRYTFRTKYARDVRTTRYPRGRVRRE